MERVMAEISQKLLHGGMRNRDWFSDKLEKEKKTPNKGLMHSYSFWQKVFFCTSRKSITCWERCTSQWWPAQTGPWSWEEMPQRSRSRCRWSPRSHHGTAWSGTAQRRGEVIKCLHVHVCEGQHERETITHQLVVGDTGAGGIVEEPPGSTANSGSTDVSCWGKITVSV